MSWQMRKETFEMVKMPDAMNESSVSDNDVIMSVQG